MLCADTTKLQVYRTPEGAPKACVNVSISLKDGVRDASERQDRLIYIYIKYIYIYYIWITHAPSPIVRTDRMDRWPCTA